MSCPRSVNTRSSFRNINDVVCHDGGAVRYKTRRECLKSALYLRLKKLKVFKIVKGGDPLGFLKVQFVANYVKNEGGPFADTKKFPEKVS